MKRIVYLLIAVLMLGAFDVQAQKKSRRRSSSKKTTRVVNTKPRVAYKEISQNGMKLTYKRIEADAFYKVTDEEKGFSNGYSDNSFAIDWPLTLNGKDAVAVQNVLLDKFAIPDFETGEVSYRPASVDELVNDRTRCRRFEDAKRVSKIPGPDPDYCLKEKFDITVYWLTPSIIGIDIAQDQYLGGGTGASVYVGSYYLNYDIENQRELTADLCFLPGLENVIAAELQRSPELWDFLWDEYKSEPFVPTNFKIEYNAITFFFSKYEIAPGAAGIVDVTIPLENVLPYASEAFQAVLKKQQGMAGDCKDPDL